MCACAFAPYVEMEIHKEEMDIHKEEMGIRKKEIRKKEMEIKVMERKWKRTALLGFCKIVSII